MIIHSIVHKMYLHINIDVCYTFCNVEYLIASHMFFLKMLFNTVSRGKLYLISQMSIAPAYLCLGRYSEAFHRNYLTHYNISLYYCDDTKRRTYISNKIANKFVQIELVIYITILLCENWRYRWFYKTCWNSTAMFFLR